MAAVFDVHLKIQQSQRSFEAATLLLRAQLCKQAIVMYWLATRERLFGCLERGQIPFDSTRAALVAAIANPKLTKISADLAFAYAVGTMTEWDESFSVTHEQASQYGDVCEALLRRFDEPFW